MGGGMAQPKPTAARQIWSNLPSAERAEQSQSGPSLATAMYPRPKPPPRDYYREAMLRGLREWQKERGR
jgi:hypothetical protein